MKAKTSVYRERFALTLEHKPVDRCPIDLGGTPQSTIETDAMIDKIAEVLLKKGTAAYPRSMMKETSRDTPQSPFSGPRPADYNKFDRRILEHFDIDFRRVGALIGFKTGREKKISDTEIVNCWGIRHRYSGKYWDIVEGPLHHATTDDVKAYEFPRVDQIPAGLLDDCAARAKNLYENTPYVIAGEHPVFGVLELACWLCGYDHIMLMLAMDPEFIHFLFGKILDFQKAIIREYYGRIGRYIHLTTSGDDFGTQKGPFMSPAMWREFVKPYMAERIKYTAQFTNAVYMHHSCGSIFDIIPDLAEIGVKILNPIQPAAEGMKPERLKETYGDRIVFHGGLDTQVVLPSNDKKAIKAAVDNLLKIMNTQKTGGYIFAAAHNIQDDVSPEAVVTMYDAAQAFFKSTKLGKK